MKGKHFYTDKKPAHCKLSTREQSFPSSCGIPASLALISEVPYHAYQPLIGKVSEIKLRILRWWHGKLYRPQSSESIIFLAVDDKGFKLQGSVPPFLAKNWIVDVEENSSCCITASQIVQSTKHPQLVDASVQLQATEQTKFEVLVDNGSHPCPSPLLTKLSILRTIGSN